MYVYMYIYIYAYAYVCGIFLLSMYLVTFRSHKTRKISQIYHRSLAGPGKRSLERSSAESLVLLELAWSIDSLFLCFNDNAFLYAYFKYLYSKNYTYIHVHVHVHIHIRIHIHIRYVYIYIYICVMIRSTLHVFTSFNVCRYMHLHL